MRTLPILFLAALLTIGTTACGSVGSGGSSVTGQSQTVGSLSSGTEALSSFCEPTGSGCSSGTMISPSSGEENDYYDFPDKELESARKAAQEYYKQYSFSIRSIQYEPSDPLCRSFYDQYSGKYDQDRLIVLKAVMNDPAENPPRRIVLTKESADSEWTVVNEGY